MYTESFRNQLTTTLEELKAEGLFKSERIIASPQGAEITLENGDKVVVNLQN